MNLKRFNSSSMVIAGLFGAGIFLASSVSAVEEPITVECPLGGGLANGIETLGMHINDKGLDGRPSPRRPTVGHSIGGFLKNARSNPDPY